MQGIRKITFHTPLSQKSIGENNPLSEAKKGGTETKKRDIQVGDPKMHQRGILWP